MARWPLRHHRGRVYELETAIQIDERPPDGPPPSASALAALLLPAMRRGRHPVVLPGPLHATTRTHLPRLQSLFAQLYDGFAPVPIWAPEPPAGGNAPPSGGRVGTMFSLGVDSFFSLLEHEDEIDDLILVRGFDIALTPEYDTLWKEVVEAGRSVAVDRGKRLVLVRTNIRAFFAERRIGWWLGHGAGMAHVALLLESWLKRVYIPSSYDYEHLGLWGSRPELDPLWGSARMELVHDGAEWIRLEKVRRVAQSPLALRHLRVCNRQPDGAYNCARCCKCVVTMLGLDTAGALGACSTLPESITPGDLRAIDRREPGGTCHLRELRDEWRGHAPEHACLPLAEEILGRHPVL